ncbi:hypothetical protein P691DRAFT_734370 [Macrolepiota fuliginosa MF-IS2]|uniref:Nephrocystin 3-like N-terminal domain-containing protein n=1 Tax=Macrolepiota fuliginosa MF-IS2 TaxID=1400762 RepID=A0A9P5X744_9AGAR|nr:hypothetical protein P691DRAFT_734370 [Macrolepiota fuliginosa MF-IS2]
MPFPPGSQNTAINGGSFVDQSIVPVTNVSLEDEQTGIDILQEASNHDAVHDSFARDYAPRCYPGTREQHIEDIVHWAIPSFGAGDPLPLLWMKGLAGVGKSAIAQTCAERLKALGTLGASFFFSINEQDQATEFIPTIVYQLSIEFPDYGDLIEQRILHHEAILDETMATQFEALIIEPLQELERTGKGIEQRIAIIVDGLDECNSTDAQCKIIELVADAARGGATPLCWAFFSRPEPHIEASFTRAGVAQVTCTTLLPISHDANSDIGLYLRSGFENILRCRNIPAEPQWPSDNDIQTLVKASNGSFAYAATALRIVAQPGSAEKALDVVCSTTKLDHTDSSPFAELDAFYMMIMQRIPPEELANTLLLCRRLCMSRSYAGRCLYGVRLWSNKLALSEIEFWAACNQLNAVLHVHDHNDSFDFTQFGDTRRPFQRADRTTIEKPRWYIRNKLGGSVYFYHKSFYDFLVDPKRSGSFCIQSSPVLNAFYKHCVDRLPKYEESYSFGELELTLAPNVPDSASSLSWPYTNEFVNSLLKALVYDWTFMTCFSFGHVPDIEIQSLQRFSHADFRKFQENRTMLYAGHGGWLASVRWGWCADVKVISRTQLFRVPPVEFRNIDVAEFKAGVKRWEKCGIIQPYYPNFTSWFKSFFPRNSQDKVISGLYRMGHGPKSVFWYWEINFEEEYYQDYVAADLAEGERIYREERFDLWPKKSW